MTVPKVETCGIITYPRFASDIGHRLLGTREMVDRFVICYLRQVLPSKQLVTQVICVVILSLLSSMARAQNEDLPNPFEFLPQQPEGEISSAEPLPTGESSNPEFQPPAILPEATESIEGNKVPEVPVDLPPAAANADQVVVAKPVDSVLNKEFKRALLIEIDGPIFDRFHWYLNNRLDLAREQQVDLIIIRLTSPGGDLEHSLQLARRLRDIDWATTVAFIPEEAISGGAIISLGCDRIYMQTGALLGDAGPIRMGLNGQFEHAEEKIVSYTAGAIREIAASQDRPTALAEAMVDRSVTVYHATQIATGKPVFLTENESQAADVAEKYVLGEPVPEAGQNRFLTVGAARALELQLCEGVFASEDDLLQQLSIGSLERTKINWVDKTVFTLNRPWLSALLLIAGLIGLYLELAAPGISVAGLASMVCFGVFFWSHFLGGTSGWLEVLLFFIGLMCLAFELFVLPGFGVFGLSGLVLVILSLVMASQDFIVPRDANQWGELRVNLVIVLGSVLGVLVLFFGQILLLDSVPGLNRFRLTAPTTDAVGQADETTTGLLQANRSVASLMPSVGAQGIAESDLRPSGKVLIDERLLDVITEGDYVEAGSRIEVLSAVGNRIIVRKV